MKRGSVFLFLVLIIFFFCPPAYSETLVFDLGSLLEGAAPDRRVIRRLGWSQLLLMTLKRCQENFAR